MRFTGLVLALLLGACTGSIRTDDVRMLQAAGDLAGAEQLLEQKIAGSQEQGDLLFLLAEVRRDRGRYAAMDSALTQMNRLYPDRYDEILEFRRHSYNQQISLGFDQFRQLNWNAAETHFRRAELAWSDGDAAFPLMIARQMNGHPDLAWESSGRLSGSKTEKARMQATLAFQDRNGVHLVEAGQRLAEKQPAVGRDWEAMGHLLDGHPDQAINLWTNLLEETQDSSDKTRYEYNLACAFFMDGRYSRTVEMLSHQKTDAAYHLQGLACLSMGRWMEALQYFSQVSHDSTSIKQFREPLEKMVSD